MCMPCSWAGWASHYLTLDKQTPSITINANMSAPSNSDHQSPLKRHNDFADDNDAKKVKTEAPDDGLPNDNQFEELFDDPNLFDDNNNPDLPDSNLDNISRENPDINMPDFLEEVKPEELLDGKPQPEHPNASPSRSSLPSKNMSPHPQPPRPASSTSLSQAPSNILVHASNAPSAAPSASTSKAPSKSPVAIHAPAPNQPSNLVSAQSSVPASNPASSSPQPPQQRYQYPHAQKQPGPSYLNQYKSSGTPGTPGTPSNVSATTYIPPSLKRPFPNPTNGASAPLTTGSIPQSSYTTTSSAYYSSNLPENGGSSAANKEKEDPSKFNDAIAAAGVDIGREEELLSTNYSRTPYSLQQQQLANRLRQLYGQANAFLQPYHVGLFMNRAARESGVVQNFMMDPEMLEFMSAACKEWLSNIVTKTVGLARHRRRGIPAFNQKPGSKQKSQPAQRSDVSRELRNLAVRQKEQEEARVAKRLALGLENKDDVAPETSKQAGAEETLHRAANATAAMMTMSSTKKKYSWMNSGGAGGADDSKLSASKESGSKQSPLISSRGENGLRYREIRTGNMITTKDLLSVLEDERMGTYKAVVKGYAKLKD